MARERCAQQSLMCSMKCFCAIVLLQPGLRMFLKCQSMLGGLWYHGRVPRCNSVVISGILQFVIVKSSELALLRNDGAWIFFSLILVSSTAWINANVSAVKMEE